MSTHAWELFAAESFDVSVPVELATRGMQRMLFDRLLSDLISASTMELGQDHALDPQEVGTTIDFHGTAA